MREWESSLRRCVLLLVLVGLIPTRLFADASLNGRSITRITFERTGGRTTEHVIRDELAVAEGQSFDPEAYLQGLQSLRNLQIFRSVEGSAAPDGEHGVALTVRLEEKWTTLPDLRFGGGGGITFYRLGIYDVNWLGRRIEGLASYENFNGTHNGEIWLKHPDAFGRGWMGGATFKRQTVFQNRYDSARGLSQSVNFVRTVNAVEWGHQVSHHLRMGGDLSRESDHFTNRFLNFEQKAANFRNPPEQPEGGTTTYLGPTLLFNNVNVYGVQYEGVRLDMRLGMASKEVTGDFSNTRFSANARLYLATPWESNLCGYLFVANSTSLEPQHAIQLGGLFEIRGYYDGEIRGRKAWYYNFEYRIPSLRWDKFLLQHVVFNDGGQADDSWDKAFRGRSLMSYGTGIRIVPTFIHLLALRLDYAVRVEAPGSGGVSFGFLQFF